MSASEESSSRKAPEDSAPPQHAVIVHLFYGKSTLQPLFDLEDRLEAAIREADAGEFDGDDVAVDGSDANLYMYGPDADRLFAVVRPILAASEYSKGATATLRYGPPENGVREIEVPVEE